MVVGISMSISMSSGTSINSGSSTGSVEGPSTSARVSLMTIADRSVSSELVPPISAPKNCGTAQLLSADGMRTSTRTISVSSVIC